MKKILILFIIMLLVLPAISAINLEVEKNATKDIMIFGINEPVMFDLKVKNLGEADSFRFDNLLGFRMFPIGTVFIGKMETKDIELIIYPREYLTIQGFYNFKYTIRASDSTEQKESVVFKIIELKDAFEIGVSEIDPESNSINVFIKNKENFNFEEINAKFSSAFFSFENTFSLNSKETKEFSVDLNNEDFNKLNAGFYDLNAEVKVNDLNANINGVIKFVEKDITTTIKTDYGFVINVKTIEKTNKGNTIFSSETVVVKNIISRLFTTFNPEPEIVEREGFKIIYTWTKNLKPGESQEIIVKTNWIFPLLIILFLIAIVILVKQYGRSDLVLRKRVSFVNAKGGEFALKVTIFVHAKKYVERVSIIDRLPSLVKVYERFGGEKPLRVDEKTRRIEWSFEKLEAGETRTLSYIIYSKIGILGKFALPSSVAIYEKDGEVHETESNRAFFVSEPRKKDVEE